MLQLQCVLKGKSAIKSNISCHVFGVLCDLFLDELKPVWAPLLTQLESAFDNYLLTCTCVCTTSFWLCFLCLILMWPTCVWATWAQENRGLSGYKWCDDASTASQVKQSKIQNISYLGYFRLTPHCSHGLWSHVVHYVVHPASEINSHQAQYWVNFLFSE